jgi:hypothetical protein
MKRPSVNILLIYVGRLPSYFHLFLRSCASNPGFNWTLATTDPVEFDLPANVRRVDFKFDDFKERIVEKLGIIPDLRRPYKICDFRPAFGCLFPEWFSGYDFWGHCDADVVFGDLERFFPAKVFEGHKKIQMRGALSFFRNDADGNSLFRLPHPFIKYGEVFSDHRYCGFDEWEGLHKILKFNGLDYFLSNDLAEIQVSRYDLVLSHRMNHVKQLFTWEDGRILRTGWIDGQGIHDEYAYIHLQKRPIDHIDVKGGGNFAFLPRAIVSIRDQAEKELLAGRNGRNRLYEIRFHATRIPRYLRSLKTVNRRYWQDSQ